MFLRRHDYRVFPDLLWDIQIFSGVLQGTRPSTGICIGISDHGTIALFDHGPGRTCSPFHLTNEMKPIYFLFSPDFYLDTTEQ